MPIATELTHILAYNNWFAWFILLTSRLYRHILHFFSYRTPFSITCIIHLFCTIYLIIILHCIIRVKIALLVVELMLIFIVIVFSWLLFIETNLRFLSLKILLLFNFYLVHIKLLCILSTMESTSYKLTVLSVSLIINNILCYDKIDII